VNRSKIISASSKIRRAKVHVVQSGEHQAAQINVREWVNNEASFLNVELDSTLMRVCMLSEISWLYPLEPKAPMESNLFKLNNGQDQETTASGM
jgi:hypothetical protein